MSEPVRDPEEEYFLRLDLEKKAQLAREVAAEKATQERAEAKALHHQRCGKCGGVLKPTGFRGVEIDVCEQCGAVLLDPGELEQLAGKDESGTIARLASLFSFKKA